MNEAIPRTLERLESGIAAGREPGVQLYASLRGEPVADVALGESRSGVAMTSDTIVLWISMSKPVMGVVIDSKRYGDGFNWFGSRASDRAFGHQGFYSSSSFCDPEHGLAVALVFHGVREDPEHDRRVVLTLDALYGDLGSAGRLQGRVRA